MSRVFISSTCYDLVDLRAELEAHLRDLGLVPLMSDRPTSEFAVAPNKDSIETCLVNVRDCDVFVCIVSQRYGPSLEKSGYPDISATHLEWQTARDAKKPIYFYVRDRTEAEYALWKKNQGADLKFGWVKDPKEYRVFELLDEHRSLVAGAAASNWIWPFRDSVDLKQRLTSDLGGVSKRALLARLLENGVLPHLAVTWGGITGGGKSTNVTMGIRVQCFGAPAINAKVVGTDPERNLQTITQGTENTFKWTFRTTEEDVLDLDFFIQYDTDRGHRIEDKFRLEYFTAQNRCQFHHLSKRLIGSTYTLA